jgi:hypothetical protein
MPKIVLAAAAVAAMVVTAPRDGRRRPDTRTLTAIRHTDAGRADGRGFANTTAGLRGAAAGVQSHLGPVNRQLERAARNQLELVRVRSVERAAPSLRGGPVFYVFYAFERARRLDGSGSARRTLADLPCTRALSRAP